MNHAVEQPTVRRIHRLFDGAEVGVNPLALSPADWPAHHDGLGTPPEAWASWTRIGSKD